MLTSKEQQEQGGFQIVKGYPKPLPFIYEDYVEGEETPKSQPMQEILTLKKVDYPQMDGVHIWVDGAEHFFRSFPPDPTDWNVIDPVKRLLVESLKIFKTWQFAFAFLLTWNKTKYIEKLIASFNDVAMKGLKHHQNKRHFFIKSEFLTPIAHEIDFGVYLFLTEIGINSEIAKTFSKIFAHLFEYDDAYRYRAHDIFSETKAHYLIESPIIEINRMMIIMESREDPNIFKKFRNLKYILCFLLLIPKIRCAFKTAVKIIVFRKLQYTEAERYWVCQSDSPYKFMGKTPEERSKIYKKKPTVSKNEEGNH